MTRRKKILFAFATLLFLVLAAEAGLRIPANFRHADKFFVRGPGGMVTFRASSSQSTFADPKPADTFRVFCFGESATEGSIYNPRSSFSKLLREMLSDLSLGVKVEVINCGMTAQNSDRVFESFRAAARYQPDLMVIYSGNNEFFRHDRHGRNFQPLVYRLREFLARHSRLYFLSRRVAFSANDIKISLMGDKMGWQGAAYFPPPLRQAIVDGFIRNVSDMTDVAAAGGAGVLLAVPAVNVRDWPPQKSVCTLGEEKCGERERALRLAELDLFAGRRSPAEAAAKAVLQQDPGNAMANFIAARVLLLAGDSASARPGLYASAEADDSLVPRTRPSQQAALRRLAAARGLGLIDAQAGFDRRSPDGITGFSLIDDYCHPTLDGQALIAALLAEKISRDYPRLFRPGAVDDLYSRRAGFLARLQIGNDFIAQRLQEMGFYLAFKFDDPVITGQALVELRRQKELVPESTLLPLTEGLVRLGQEADEPARAAFERALRENPQHAARMIGFYFRRFLRWQPPYLLARSKPGISLAPILNDYLSKKKSEMLLPLEDASRVYQLSGATLSDVTAAVRPLVEERRALTPPAPLTLFPPPVDDQVHFSVSALSRSGDRFAAAGPDPRLLFGFLNLDPRGYSAFELEIEADDPAAGPVCVLWRREKSAYGFSEANKACAPQPLIPGKNIYLVPLGDDPDWLQARPVQTIRLDPGENPVSFRLLGVRLVPYMRPQK